MKNIFAICLSLLTLSFASFASAAQKTAVFAGGCFWCMEKPFDKLSGVISTTPGYAGGTFVDPTYETVSAGKTDHREVISVIYDDSKISYEELLSVFWKNIDPFDADGQFCDKGFQYSPAILTNSEEQALAANKSVENNEKRFQQKLAVPVAPVKTFYPAEQYHHDYYKKKPLKYEFYRLACGRDSRLEEVWQ